MLHAGNRIDTHTCERLESTHSHSITLLSHSPRPHFSQSPGVCEGTVRVELTHARAAREGLC